MSEVTNTKLRALVDAKRERDRLRMAYEEADRAHRQIQMEVWSSMETNGDKTLTKELGEGYGTITFGRRQTVYSRILDNETAAESLRQLGLDHMLKPGFEKARLNEMIREYIEQGRTPPEGIDFTSTEYVSIAHRG